MVLYHCNQLTPDVQANRKQLNQTNSEGQPGSIWVFKVLDLDISIMYEPNCPILKVGIHVKTDQLKRGQELHIIEQSHMSIVFCNVMKVLHQPVNQN